LPWNPFVSGIVDAFYDTGSLYHLLELAPSGNLAHIIRKHSPISHGTAAFYFANIVCGIEFLHANGIIHRDLKPANILVGQDGYLVLADFGTGVKSHDNVEYFLVGTPAYMAPELISRREFIREAVDWWAAGCILYEMLTKRMVPDPLIQVNEGLPNF
jgi:serine/threonine protein kinase